MKSAKMMSAEIRRKKKAMQDDEGVVDLSGIPEDATDLANLETAAYTDELGLDENKPKSHDEDPTPSAHQELMEDSAQRKMHAADHETENTPNPETDYAEGGEVEAKMRRRARLAKAMGRIG